jgi:hypothetical protein
MACVGNSPDLARTTLARAPGGVGIQKCESVMMLDGVQSPSILDQADKNAPLLNAKSLEY